MTKTGPSKRVGNDFWCGRLECARAFRAAAGQLIELAVEGQNCNPIFSTISLGAVAFCDALTAKRAGVINQQDHAGAARLLRDVMRQTLPDAQERQFKRMLSRKDEVQYGVRRASLSDARLAFEELRAFGSWCEDWLG